MYLKRKWAEERSNHNVSLDMSIPQKFFRFRTRRKYVSSDPSNISFLSEFVFFDNLVIRMLSANIVVFTQTIGIEVRLHAHMSENSLRLPFEKILKKRPFSSFKTSTFKMKLRAKSFLWKMSHVCTRIKLKK